MRLQVNDLLLSRAPTEFFYLCRPQPVGTTVGRLDGQAIPQAVIDEHGLVYSFVGVARRDARGRIDVSALRAGEWVVQPGLIYKLVDRGETVFI